ncbi:MAG: hypothetical protein ACR2KK_05295 [Acidimicrobiales bacterium]
MSERTSVATDAAGRRVMAKVAGNAEEAVRLEREAAQLEAARHPGVVELVGVDGHGVGAILLTAHVEGPTLGRVGRLPLEEATGLLAALGTTLADLHELGLVHGAVSADHVIVGPGGRPILCGLAYGGRVGQPAGPAARPPAFADPARADDGTLTPAFDVFGVGALARFLAPDPPPGHVLARIAEEATSGAVSARPSARALAELLQSAVPTARLPRGLQPDPPVPARPVADPMAALRQGRSSLGGGRPTRLRPAALVAAVAAVGVVGAAIVLAGSLKPAPPAMVAPAVPSSDTVPPDEGQPGPTTTRSGLVPSSPSTVFPSSTVVSRRADCPPATGVLHADVDSDGCADALRYVDGVLQAGDVRWALGRAGDQVAVGDWACQGSRTLALFRPSTGEVFRFDAWASPGQDLTAPAVARVPGGVALRAADVDRDGCHEVVVERAAGAAEIVRLPRARP